MILYIYFGFPRFLRIESPHFSAGIYSAEAQGWYRNARSNLCGALCALAGQGHPRPAWDHLRRNDCPLNRHRGLAELRGDLPNAPAIRSQLARLVAVKHVAIRRVCKAAFN